jgi:hypothetical protein
MYIVIHNIYIISLYFAAISVGFNTINYSKNKHLIYYFITSICSSFNIDFNCQLFTTESSYFAYDSIIIPSILLSFYKSKKYISIILPLLCISMQYILTKMEISNQFHPVLFLLLLVVYIVHIAMYQSRKTIKINIEYLIIAILLILNLYFIIIQYYFNISSLINNAYTRVYFINSLVLVTFYLYVIISNIKCRFLL